MREHKDNIPAEVVKGIEDAVSDLRQVMDSEDPDAEKVRQKIQDLQTATMKIGESLNKSTSSEGAKTEDAEYADKKEEGDGEKKDEKK